MVEQDPEVRAQKVLDSLAAEFVTWLPETRPLARVQDGSRMALDDACYELDATSHIVQPLINTAREHLFALGLLWRSSEGTYLLPRSYSTLLRASLLSAATAAWILTPEDRDTRVSRSLLVAIDDIKNERIAADAMAKSPYATQRFNSLQVDLARHQLSTAREHEEAAKDRLWELSGEIGERRKKGWFESYCRQHYSSSKAVREAFEALYPNSPLHRAGGNLLWQMMSGDTHGYRWQTQVRAGHTGERDRLLAQEGRVLQMADYTVCSLLLPQVSLVRELYEYSEQLWALAATR